MLNLLFRSGSSKTVVTNSANGSVLYQTETHGITHRTIRIEKFNAKTGFQLLAGIHLKMLVHPQTIEYKGQTTSVSDFLVPRDGGRFFVTSDGREYLWRPDDALNLTLEDDSGTVIAKSYNHYGFFHEARNYSVDVSHDSLQILDDIVVTFIVENASMLHKSYERNAGKLILGFAKQIEEGFIEAAAHEIL